MKFFTDWIRSIDKFADPVQVKYRGTGGFKTYCGGVLTLISKSVVTFFMIKNAERLFLRLNPDVVTTEYFTNYEKDTKQYNFAE